MVGEHCESGAHRRDESLYAAQQVSHGACHHREDSWNNFWALLMCTSCERRDGCFNTMAWRALTAGARAMPETSGPSRADTPGCAYRRDAPATPRGLARDGNILRR